MLRRSWQLNTSTLKGRTVSSDASAAGGGGKGSGMSTGRRMGRRGTQVVGATLGILDGHNRVAYRFGSALRYARIEFGMGRVAPRPYIRPTLDAIRDLFPDVMAAAIRRNLRGGNR